MILAIDIGNTNIVIGCIDKKKTYFIERLSTVRTKTELEYAIDIKTVLDIYEIDYDAIEGGIISSVVPQITNVAKLAAEKIIKKDVMVLGPGIKTGIKIITENPREVGADRIVDAVAAYEKYGGPVIVVDFGTATTYDIVSKEGGFEGGGISPGIRTSARALWGGAAMLPEIEIRKPNSVIAKETVSSMQGGLVFGYIGQTEYIIKKIKAAGYEDAKVVATGGLGNIIVPETDSIDIYDPKLTLDGLRMIYEKCKKAEK